ncbi:Outer membrane protein (Porin) [Paraburkholderia unamae]|uniref:porin n=1 Tax=Paraburkholderia unamae TaxID=219649 RepID=UPI001CAD0368|nr:porin [Paraburkholderia unamae]CAG9271520.1 Outer membrane protein (Porin) [Paraburkholderia unamae]
MKNTVIASVLLASVSSAASAQSSVTLYGIVDTDIRYVTNTNKNGDSSIGMGNGGLAESRFGVKGAEDLGQGLSTIFQLENRFYANSGQLDSAKPFWNTAFVGVRSKQWGELTIGRQSTTLISIVSQAYASNPWVPFSNVFLPEVIMVGGDRTSNLVKYTLRAADLYGQASYALGGVAGHSGYGSQTAVGVGWFPGAVRIAGGYAVIHDSTNGAPAQIWTAGGSYTWNTTQFHAGYFQSRLSSNFMSYQNGPYSEQALSAIKYLDFSSRRMMSLGVTQSVGPALHLAFNYWRTWQTGKTEKQDGTASQFQLLADYYLSKRTDVYLEGDYGLYRQDLIGTTLAGLSSGGAPAKSTQLGVTVGIRHSF